MKGLKIVLMLAVIVIIGSVGVFLVEDFTTPIIEANLQTEIENALKEVYPAIEGSGYSVEDSTIDFGTTGVIGIIEVKDGDTIKAVIYTVEFTGFASTIKYLVAIDGEGNITGYKTLAQNDTAGYGAQIADPVNWAQLIGLSIEAAGEGNFDGLSGASVTTGKWKASFAALYEFHAKNFPIQALTEEQKMLAKAQEFAPTGTTVSLYEATNPYAANGIGYVFVANDGTNDVLAIYYVSFFGLYGDNEIMVSIDLDTNNVVEFKALSSGDTPDFGGQILDEANWTQFVDKTTHNLVAQDFDGIAGSTGTSDAWKTAMQSLAIWHQAEFMGIVSLTPEQQFEVYKQELFEDATMFTDVTAEKPANMNVTNIFDAYDVDSTYLGTIYFVTSIGANYGGPTYIQFLVGIDATGDFTGFRMVKTTDTESKVAPFFADDYIDTLVGDSTTGVYGIDTVAGATDTTTIINTVITQIVEYHENDYFSRPDSIETSNARLLAAFPTAVSFESVYDDYEYSSSIGNIYAAKDGSGTILGYVYLGQTVGKDGTIFFTLGVDTAGLTQVFNVWGSAETWDQAEEYDSYTGSEGTNFLTTSWFDNFEGVTIQSLVDSPIDSVSGVTVTTGPLSTTLEAIANYHIDKSVGGAN